ncbi:hypothetical protein [Methyloraptor flagellatus]|jgi:hypothetical protein|uniref:DUF1844 domain-containing protein n=1 Tax=Methyloraptor flagellatus TaxID=3162530 RepID=A0AAU7XFT2_9HYPH
MATFRIPGLPAIQLPFSGDVSQVIAPLTSWFSGNRYSLFSIDLGRSSAPEVERVILDEVGSYGRQLGRIGEALAVLVDHFEPKGELSPRERKALAALTVMIDEIEAIKRRQEQDAKAEG